MRVAILVTHLLGTGHLKRASLLADGFVNAGHDAIVLSGGFPAPNAAPSHAPLVQLPPLRSDASFSGLFSEDGAATPAFLAQRIAAIRTTLADFAPDMLITELFPFGRRKLAAEFEAAIDAAKGALIYTSIRDILQRPSKPGRIEEANDRFARHYHGAFVHGDPALTPLEDSWPLPAPLRDRIAYTGFVTPKPSDAIDSGQDGTGEIIVAAGGGSVGNALFHAAAEADDHHWRLLVGGHDRTERIVSLKASGSTAIIEPVRPDFRALLARADLAILQCGYNSALDVIETGVRALFVPFEGDGETEQITRARAFQARYGCGLIRERDLSAATLKREADRLVALPKPDYRGLQLNGVSRTVALAEAALEARNG